MVRRREALWTLLTLTPRGGVAALRRHEKMGYGEDYVGLLAGALPFFLRIVHRIRPSYSPWGTRTGALLKISDLLLVLVENHSIHHDIVACANVVHSDRNPDFHPRPYDVFIEHFTAPRQICDRLTKMVGSRPAAFLKHDYASRSVLRDGSAAFGGSRCCSRL